MPSKFQDYEVLGKIGSGSYGTCKKIRRKSDGKILVWKELDYGNMTEAEKQMLVSEVNVLRELKHPNIVRYYDRIIDRINTTIFIVMEYCERGDLGALISKHRKEKKHMDENFVWKVLLQLVLAVRECHQRKDGGHVLHRDLKPANVFLDANNNVKLGDFGLARVLMHETSFAKTFVGTPYYMSPEQVNNLCYNEKSDIWSLGCLMYEVCALTPPFTALSKRSLEAKIRIGKFHPIPSHFSAELSLVISSMLRVDYKSRPCIEDLLGSPVLSKLLRESSTQSDVKVKEDFLRKMEHRLAEKEKELERREKSLATRERLVSDREDKVSRTEASLRYHNFQDAAPPLKRNCYQIDRNLAVGKENDDPWNGKPSYQNFGAVQETKLARDVFRNEPHQNYRRFTEHGYQHPTFAGANPVFKRALVPGLLRAMR